MPTYKRIKNKNKKCEKHASEYYIMRNLWHRISFSFTFCCVPNKRFYFFLYCRIKTRVTFIYQTSLKALQSDWCVYVCFSYRQCHWVAQSIFQKQRGSFFSQSSIQTVQHLLKTHIINARFKVTFFSFSFSFSLFLIWASIIWFIISFDCFAISVFFTFALWVTKKRAFASVYDWWWAIAPDQRENR